MSLNMGQIINISDLLEKLVKIKNFFDKKHSNGQSLTVKVKNQQLHFKLHTYYLKWH